MTRPAALLGAGVPVRPVAPRRQPSILRYAVALLLAAAATLLRGLLDPALGAAVPFVFHFLAILLAAWFAGLGAGIVATLASAAAVDFFFVEPRLMFTALSFPDLASLTAFTATGCGLSWLTSRWRASARRVAGSRDALRQRADRLALHATLLAQAHDAIVVRDDQQRVTVWNREAEALYGWTAAEAIGRDAHDLLGVDAVTRAALREALARDGTWSGTLEHRRQDGRRVLTESRQAVVEGGAVLEVNRDITERVRAEAALVANERTLTALMDASTESILLFDRDTVLTANTTAAARFDTSAEELRGLRWKALLPPGLAAARAAKLDEVYDTGQPVRFEDERTGRRFEHTFYPVFGDGGAVTAVAAFSRDVTDTRLAERELQVMSQRLAYHVRHSPLAVVEFGPDLRITRWAGEAERLFGWTADEVLGKRRDEFPWIHPDDVGKVAEVAASLRSGAEPQRFSANRNLRKDGTVVHCEWYNSSLVDAAGALQSVLSLVLDVTERTRLEEALRARAEELARANRLKDEFLATLSHELRTPLHAILGWAELLARHADAPEPLKVGLSTISRNARLQSHIVDDLLDVSRIVTGSFRLTITAVDVRAAAEHALDAVRPAAEAKHLVLHTRVASGLVVPADAVRLQQVVWNLLANAVKFTPAGGEVTIAARATAQAVEITVSDTGVGIPADFLPRVFERFSQADSSLTRAHGGLGLGLAIVRHIVELHGGTVSASSGGEGRGAAFAVRLPLAAAAGGGSAGGGGHAGVDEIPAVPAAPRPAPSGEGAAQNRTPAGAPGDAPAGRSSAAAEAQRDTAAGAAEVPIEDLRSADEAVAHPGIEA